MERVENQKVCQRVLPSPLSLAQSGYQTLYSIFVGGGNFPVFRGKRLVGGFESFVPFFSRVEGKLCVVVCLLSASNPLLLHPLLPFLEIWELNFRYTPPSFLKCVCQFPL